MAKASAYFTFEILDNEHDVKLIKKEIDSLRGVSSVSINLEKNRVCVDYDTTGMNEKVIGDEIKRLGFDAKLEIQEDHIM